MSLATDSIFIQALSQSADIMEATSGRLYGTAIPLPDEDADNVPTPYLIVTFQGLNNTSQTKDDRYESSYDQVTISIELAAKTLDQLHDLSQMVRDVVLDYFRTNDTAVYDYQFSSQPIQYDSLKPCYWQVLTYQCEVDNQFYD